MRKYPDENKIARTLREIRIRCTRARVLPRIFMKMRGNSRIEILFFFPADFICCINKIHESGALPLIIIPCCPTNCERLLQATSTVAFNDVAAFVTGYYAVPLLELESSY